jgi:riboflavin kinase/FMN adenylyltransferase
MKVAYSLAEIALPKTSIVLTIGSFDGVHLGHQAILKHLTQTAAKQNAISVVLTFSNHPSKVLQPNHTTPLLCSIDHKLLLLEEAKIFATILLPFTKKFSQQSADTFIKAVREVLPFQTLILGSDAQFGKDREGDRLTVTSFAKNQGFTAEYLPDIIMNGLRISSSHIRDLVQNGLLKEAEVLLGRPYSIYGPILKGSGRGAPLGFPTANLNVNDLCLPPFGVYAVTLRKDNIKFEGVANLGFAPTMRSDDEPLLEVHLFDYKSDFYGKYVDVQFHQYIRPEKLFANAEELKNQIALDVIEARRIHLNLTCAPNNE